MKKNNYNKCISIKNYLILKKGIEFKNLQKIKVVFW